MVYWDFYLTIGLFVAGVGLLTILLILRHVMIKRRALKELRDHRRRLTNEYRVPVEKGLDPWAKEEVTIQPAQATPVERESKYDWQKESI